MPHVFIGFGWEWKEIEKEYIEGQLKGLNVDVHIKFEDFFREIYRITTINSAKYDLVLRCIYNVKPFVGPLVIANQEELEFIKMGVTCHKLLFWFVRY